MLDGYRLQYENSYKTSELIGRGTYLVMVESSDLGERVLRSVFGMLSLFFLRPGAVGCGRAVFQGSVVYLG